MQAFTAQRSATIKLIKQDAVEEGEEMRDTWTLHSLCEGEEIALFSAVSPQLWCYSTGLGKITEGNTPRRSKSEVTCSIC